MRNVRGLTGSGWVVTALLLAAAVTGWQGSQWQSSQWQQGDKKPDVLAPQPGLQAALRLCCL